MARPKKEQVAKNVGLRMTPEDWELLEIKAKALGFQGRAELIRAIARGQASPQDRKAVVLGESVPG